MTGDAHKRYLEKISIIGGQDPYVIPDVEWSTNPDMFPSLSYIDIVNYLVLGSSPFYSMVEFKNYKSLEAYDRFLSGWVQKVQVFATSCNVEGSILNMSVVRAKVNHSQRLSESPVACWIILKEDGCIMSCHCTCMAGLGESCSHAAATMFYIEAAVRLKEKKTVTQEPAYWLLPSSQRNVEYAALKDINFTATESMKKKMDNLIDGDDRSHACSLLGKRKKATYSATSDEFNKFLSAIAPSKPAFHAVYPTFSSNFCPKALHDNYPKVLTELYDEESSNLSYKNLLEFCNSIELKISEQQIRRVEKETRGQYKSPLWFSFRAGRVTASKFKQSVSTSFTNPSISLVKQICYPNKYKFQTAATKWGLDNEHIAKQAYLDIKCKQHQSLKIVDTGLYLSIDYPFIGASPDAIVQCSCCLSKPLEIKCPYAVRDEKFDSLPTNFYLECAGGKLSLKKNHNYYYQIQMQMALTNSASCDFVVWTTRDIHIEEVSFDQSFWEVQINRCHQFFSLVIMPELVAKHFSKIVNTTTPNPIALDHCYSMSTSHPECDEPKKKQNT